MKKLDFVLREGDIVDSSFLVGSPAFQVVHELTGCHWGFLPGITVLFGRQSVRPPCNEIGCYHGSVKSMHGSLVYMNLCLLSVPLHLAVTCSFFFFKHRLWGKNLSAYKVLHQPNFPPSFWPVVFLTQLPRIVPRHSHIGEVVEKMAEGR